MTIYSAGAPRATLQLLIVALAAGVILLLPSYYYLFRIFKGGIFVTAPSANSVEEYYNKDRTRGE
jgi:cytochrome bd-type quinol oxidase subunit 2